MSSCLKNFFIINSDNVFYQNTRLNDLKVKLKDWIINFDSVNQTDLVDTKMNLSPAIFQSEFKQWCCFFVTHCVHAYLS